MNSVFVNPVIYSGAVDAFLEISTHLFLPYLSNLLITWHLTGCGDADPHTSLKSASST